MGICLGMSPHLIRLMNPEDQARYGAVPDAVPTPRLDPQPLCKPGTIERKEQASFANWLLLQNSNGRKIPFCWHATHPRSKASPGTPDFWIGFAGRSMWFEFKRDSSCKLSSEQEEFRVCCACQRIEWHRVHSAAEAIEIVMNAGVNSSCSGSGSLSIPVSK